MAWFTRKAEQDKAEALIPAFLSQDPSPELEEKFSDQAIRLLALLATADNILSWPKYELVQQALEDVLSEKANDPKIRAKLLYCLAVSSDKEEPLESMFERIKLAAEKERVTFEQRKALVDAVIRIAEESRQLDDSLSVSCHGLAQVLGVPTRTAVTMGMPSQSEGWTSSVWDYVMALPGIGATREVQPLRSSTAVLNSKVESSIHNLRQIAWTMNDAELESRISAFESLMEAQPFRIVFVGETKRGKSSLINALVGEELSPVRETVAETGTIVEFGFNHAPRYGGEWLGSTHLEWLEDFLAKERDSQLLQDKMRLVRAAQHANAFNMGDTISEIRSADDLPDFISASGKWTNLVRRVVIGWPIECLKAGAFLVDTPGLNAIDRFHEYLALEESRSADCIVFVMEANREPTDSERRLLSGLVESGRAYNIVGVITRVDQIQEEQTLPVLVERVRAFLHDVCRGNSAIILRGVIPVNARLAMQENLTASTLKLKSESGFKALQDCIFQVLVDDSNKSAYRQRLTEQHAALRSFAETRCSEFREKCVASLPPERVRQAHRRYAESFANIARFLKEDITKRLQAVEIDLKLLVEDSNRDIAETRANLTNEMEKEVWATIVSLDKDFLDHRRWEEFNRLVAPGIARRHLSGFEARHSKKMEAWIENLRLYQQDLGTLRLDAFNQISSRSAEWAGVCPEDTRFTHFLVKINQRIRQIEAVALLGGGGFALAKGAAVFQVLGTLATMAGGWPIVATAVAALGTARLLLGMAGDIETRRKQHFAKTQKHISEILDKDFGETKTRIDDLASKLAELYREVTTEYCFPVLELAAYNALAASLEAEVIDRIERDAAKFEAFINEELAKITPLRSL